MENMENATRKCSNKQNIRFKFNIYGGLPPRDLDILQPDEISEAIENVTTNYRLGILNSFREKKKLLVLDVDCTLTCRDGTPRSHLHEMLTQVYRHYDIVLWSASGREEMLDKIQSLNLLGNENFKFALFLDKDAMVPVFAKNESFKRFMAKPLRFIWNKFPQFSARDTIMFDDDWRHYALNKKSGISTKRSSRFDNDGHGRALLEVAAYLTKISEEQTFEKIDHKQWMKSMYRRIAKLGSAAEIIEDDIPISAFAIQAKANIQLLNSSIQLPPDAQINQSLKLLKFKVETQLPTTTNQFELSEVLADLESPDIYFIHLDDKMLSIKIDLMNPLRENKKLLVLSLDHTLCDSDIDGFPCLEARRPYIVEFLSRVYQQYDIAIWCAKNRKWITNTMRELQIIDNENYKIAFYLTAQSMIAVTSKTFGLLEVKPLEFVWGKFPGYYARNTIIVDDVEKTSMMNPQSGLQVKPYRMENESIDTELRILARYLETIASVEDFRLLDHKNWKCIDKLSNINDDEPVNTSSNSLTVNIDWPGNKIELVDVHEDTTIGNLRNLISDVIDTPVEKQNLGIPLHVAQSPKIQPYINKGMVILEESYSGLLPVNNEFDQNAVNPFGVSYFQNKVSLGQPHEQSGAMFQVPKDGACPAKANTQAREFSSILDADSFDHSPEELTVFRLEDCEKISKISFSNSQVNLELESFNTIPDLSMNTETNAKSLEVDMASFFPASKSIVQATEMLEIANPEVYTAEIEDRVLNYEITQLNSFRANQKLLVLDLDHTLYDPIVPPVAAGSARRPFLQNLLSRAYISYDIIIWSDRSKKSTWEVLEALKMIDNSSFKIACYLTAQAKVEVTTQRGSIEVKPLEVIWGKFPQFSAQNTIIIDDNGWNFRMNHQSGFEIPPYKCVNSFMDKQLKTLSGYLELIAQIDDFREIRHGSWKLPGKILKIKKDGEIEQTDDRVDVVVSWSDNRLVFKNIHVETTIGEIKVLINNVIDLAVEVQELLYKAEGFRRIILPSVSIYHKSSK